MRKNQKLFVFVLFLGIAALSGCGLVQGTTKEPAPIQVEEASKTGLHPVPFVTLDLEAPTETLPTEQSDLSLTLSLNPNGRYRAVLLNQGEPRYFSSAKPFYFKLSDGSKTLIRMLRPPVQRSIRKGESKLDTGQSIVQEFSASDIVHGTKISDFDKGKLVVSVLSDSGSTEKDLEQRENETPKLMTSISPQLESKALSLSIP